MNAWSEPPTCELCGNQRSGEVAVRLIRWAKADPGMSYEHLHACRDHEACRRRVIDSGKEWPLYEKAT